MRFAVASWRGGVAGLGPTNRSFPARGGQEAWRTANNAPPRAGNRDMRGGATSPHPSTVYIL